MSDVKVALHISGPLEIVNEYLKLLAIRHGETPLDLTEGIEVEVDVPEQSIGGSMLGLQIAPKRFPLGRTRSQRPAPEPKVFLRELSEVQIDDLDLNVRAYNCLKRAGVQTVADLVGKTEKDLQAIPNLHEASRQEIKDALAEYDLELRLDVESALDTMLIEELELGVRAYGNLKRSGIQTVGELVAKTVEEIRDIRGIGPDSEEQVRETLQARGLYLKGDGAPTGPLDLPDGVEPSIKVGGIGLVPRTSNLLKRANIRTLGDLLTSTWQELNEIPGFGPGSEREVREALQRTHSNLGLKLKKA